MRAETVGRGRAGGVVADRGQERRRAVEAAHLHGRDATPAPGLGEVLARVEDLAGHRQALDNVDVDPLDVSDDAGAEAHRTSVAPCRRSQRRGSR